MSLNSPTITASCEECFEDSEPMGPASLAGGGWDDRNVNRSLERQHWVVTDDGRTYCENCAAESGRAKT